jgi:hypothetical protein
MRRQGYLGQRGAPEQKPASEEEKPKAKRLSPVEQSKAAKAKGHVLAPGAALPLALEYGKLGLRAP